MVYEYGDVVKLNDGGLACFDIRPPRALLENGKSKEIKEKDVKEILFKAVDVTIEAKDGFVKTEYKGMTATQPINNDSLCVCKCLIELAQKLEGKDGN